MFIIVLSIVWLSHVYLSSLRFMTIHFVRVFLIDLEWVYMCFHCYYTHDSIVYCIPHYTGQPHTHRYTETTRWSWICFKEETTVSTQAPVTGIVCSIIVNICCILVEHINHNNINTVQLIVWVCMIIGSILNQSNSIPGQVTTSRLLFILWN